MYEHMVNMIIRVCEQARDRRLHVYAVLDFVVVNRKCNGNASNGECIYLRAFTQFTQTFKFSFCFILPLICAVASWPTLFGATNIHDARTSNVSQMRWRETKVNLLGASTLHTHSTYMQTDRLYLYNIAIVYSHTCFVFMLQQSEKCAGCYWGWQQRCVFVMLVSMHYGTISWIVLSSMFVSSKLICGQRSYCRAHYPIELNNI